MTTYIVTFEVNDTTRKNNLEEKLRQFIDYRSIHGSCWAVVSDKDPVDIFYFLSETLDLTDKLFIIRSGTRAVWNNIGDENNEWLKERL